MNTFSLLLYVPDKHAATLPKRIADAIRIVSSRGARINLLVTVAEIGELYLLPPIKWVNVRKDRNDRTGEINTYADVDPAYFAEHFPNTGNFDAVGVCFDRADWYKERTEPDFFQVGVTIKGPAGDFCFTDPRGIKYDLGGGEFVHPWTWILLHELSHVMYHDFMSAFYDPTHEYDYKDHNLQSAIAGWSLARVSMLKAILDKLKALVEAIKNQKPTTPMPTMPTPEPVSSLDRLVQALIQVESNGKDNAVGDLHLAQKAYGPLQIREPVCIDVNRVHGTKLKATDMLNNRPLSIDTFKKYMAIYATRARLGFEPTDETRARIWNGGPAGWKKAATEAYWRKAKTALAALTG